VLPERAKYLLVKEERTKDRFSELEDGIIGPT